VTPPLLDVDRSSGVVEGVPAVPSRAATVVSGRLAQLTCAVAIAPFAILTVLFFGGDTI